MPRIFGAAWASTVDQRVEKPFAALARWGSQQVGDPNLVRSLKDGLEGRATHLTVLTEICAADSGGAPLEPVSSEGLPRSRLQVPSHPTPRPETARRGAR